MCTNGKNTCEKKLKIINHQGNTVRWHCPPSGMTKITSIGEDEKQL